MTLGKAVPSMESSSLAGAPVMNSWGTMIPTLSSAKPSISSPPLSTKKGGALFPRRKFLELPRGRPRGHLRPCELLLLFSHQVMSEFLIP